MQRIRLDERVEFSRIIHGLWRAAEWKLTDQELLHIIEECLEMGVTTFDHADIYGDYSCQKIFGRALQLKPSLREKMEIITKCGIKLISPKHPEHKIKYYDTSKEHILRSVDNSLQELGTDYIDVLLIHRPDPFMDPEEVAETFSQLKAQGKVLSFGVSNFSSSQYEMLQSYVDVPLVTNQIEISVMHVDPFVDGSIDHCQMKKIPPLAWSPLAGGKIFKSEDEKAVRIQNVLKEIAGELDIDSIDVVMYAWLFVHPSTIIPIVGSGKLERIRNAVTALSVSLTRQQWFEIWQASTGRQVP
ncbi:aldo/keto reductase [Aneurinibacillus terranovensis]|uniref:aldo/keto reductase n=1 Tax=Aneurinibacillus terranovensis TaxID=278991 RepID=UPI00042273F5|nr:aldo/keto reductase [Aneurinibacillus terranovensis]